MKPKNKIDRAADNAVFLGYIMIGICILTILSIAVVIIFPQLSVY